MFRAGPITVWLRISLPPPGTGPFTTTTSGATVVLEIANSSTLNQDVELEVQIANGFLEFPALGSNWTAKAVAVPCLLTRAAAYNRTYPIQHAGNPGGGSETVLCALLRYKQSSHPTFTSVSITGPGNSDVVAVT